MSGQAVVTGIGVTAPNGIGAHDYWDAVRGGRSGIGPITRFDASGYPVALAGRSPSARPNGTCPSGSCRRATG